MVHNVRDMSSANSKSFSQFYLRELTRCVKSLYCFCILFLESLCQMVSVWKHSVPSFPTSIFCVVFVSAYKKMIWITAWWVITAMEHAHSIWNKSMFNYPCDPVCAGVSEYSATNGDNPITRIVFRTRPNPTAISLFDSHPKPSLKSGVEVLPSCRADDTLFLHNKFDLLCRAPGCWFSAGATC